MPTAPVIDYLVIGMPSGTREELVSRLHEREAKLHVYPELDEAVAEAQGGLPALILLGPTAGGDALARTVSRTRRAFPLSPVVCFGLEPEVTTVVSALRAGASDFLLDEDSAEHLEHIDRIRAEQRYLPRLRKLRDKLHEEWRFEGFLSRSQKMWDVFELVERVADTDATVLIEGETGTGKELLARAVYHCSGRRDAPFLAINCGALTDTLLDSELFGHERGAFTGATGRKIGLFEQADGGTLFLDEIGNVSENLQQRLLRVLESGAFRRVGGGQELQTDARIVAATNTDLLEAVQQGNFREDLYYRLNVIHLGVPPLRERPEDVLLLLNHFLGAFARRYRVKKPKPSETVVDRLLSHPWPGNVRELQNLTERLVLVARNGVIQTRHLPPNVFGEDEQAARPETRLPNLEKTLPEVIADVSAEVEQAYLERLLDKYAGRIQRCAEHAGVSRRTLHRKLIEHGIDKKKYKSRSKTSS